MPTSTMVVTSQTIEIDRITDVSVSAIAHDDVAGDYYRDFVFFGTAPPLPEGTEEEIVGTIPTTLKIRIRAETAEPLQVTFPQGEF
jgi:hypothetical protein